MNWLSNFVKPKLKALVGNRKEVPDNLWKSCPKCGNMMHHKDLFENLDVCSSCNYHFRMSVNRRIEILFDFILKLRHTHPISANFFVYSSSTFSPDRE